MKDIKKMNNTDEMGQTVVFEGLEIVSGEGDGPGTEEPYTGRPSIRALKGKLKREECGGDRWAWAFAKDGTRYVF